MTCEPKCHAYGIGCACNPGVLVRVGSGHRKVGSHQPHECTPPVDPSCGAEEWTCDCGMTWRSYRVGDRGGWTALRKGTVPWPARCWECGGAANRVNPNGSGSVGCDTCFPGWGDMCWRDDCTREMGHKGKHRWTQ